MGDFGIGLLAQGRRKPDLRQPQQQDPISPIEKFFGGRGDPLLSAEANQQAADDALLAAGLQMLLASNPTAGAAGNIANILAQGALAGQGVGAQSRQAAMARQAQAQVGQLLTSGQLQSRQDLENAMLQLAAAGAIDEAKLVRDILKNRGEPEPSQLVQVEVDGKLRFARSGPDGFKLLRGQGREIPAGLEAGEPVEVVDEFGRPTVAFQLGERNLEKITGPAGQTQFVDPDEGRVISEFAGQQPGAAQAPSAPRTFFDPVTNRNVEAQVFPDGVVRELGSGRVIDRPLPARTIPAETQAFAVSALPRLEASLEALTSIGRPPDEAKSFLGRGIPAKVGGRRLLNREAQQYIAAGDQFIADIVRIISGKQASDREREMLQAAFIPQPGERAEVVESKLRQLEEFVEGARRISRGEIGSVPPDLAAEIMSLPGPAGDAMRARVRAGEVNIGNPEGGNVVGQGDDPFRDLGQ